MKKRKGISLIVLVITIIIIVILSTAILVSVVSNNPVMEANKARYDSDTANMQAIFTNTVAKVMAQNRASIEIRPDRINEFVSGVSETLGEVSYTVIDAMDINNTTGTIYFDKGTNTNTEFYTGRKLPIYSAGETKWYVDEEGNISLEVAGIKYGNGETIVLEGEGQTYHTLAPSTLSFRSTADLEDFKEIKINGATIDPSNYTLTEGSTIVTLSIDYLKTLDEKEHEITIVSESGSPSTRFKVVAPDLNEYGFYYNQPYTAYVDALGANIVIFVEEKEKCNLITYIKGDSTHSVENCTYTISENSISFNTSLGIFEFTILNDEKSLYCKDFDINFEIGDESIVADEEYIYIYDKTLGGYVVDIIEENKDFYIPIKTGINGFPTVKMYKYIFDNNKNITEMPQMPDTITSIDFSAFSYSGLTSVIIPNNIITIGEFSFDNCYNLTNLIISNNVMSIGENAFYNCTSLTNITFDGTKDEWNNIKKGLNWNEYVPATHVKCSDGVVPLK